MRGDVPAALPGVLADEFSLANFVRAANVKLAAAMSELKSGDPSCWFHIWRLFFLELEAPD